MTFKGDEKQLVARHLFEVSPSLKDFYSPFIGTKKVKLYNREGDFNYPQDQEEAFWI